MSHPFSHPPLFLPPLFFPLLLPSPLLLQRRLPLAMWTTTATLMCLLARVVLLTLCTTRATVASLHSNLTHLNNYPPTKAHLTRLLPCPSLSLSYTHTHTLSLSLISRDLDLTEVTVLFCCCCCCRCLLCPFYLLVFFDSFVKLFFFSFLVSFLCVRVHARVLGFSFSSFLFILCSCCCFVHDSSWHDQ